MAEGSRELQMWLGANISEGYRAAVSAVADTLEDLRSSDLDELEDVLALNSWPVLTRRRFVDAWRELKGEGAAPAPMAVDTPEPVAEPVVESAPEPRAEPAPVPEPAPAPIPAPAPRDEGTLEPRDGDDEIKRRRWSKRADEKLRDGVRALGTDDWARVCSQYLSGHGHSPDQCRQRWEQVLSKGLVKGAFTPDEDAIILEMFSNGQQPSWKDVAARIPGRVGKQVRERWTNYLDPNLKKGNWTPEEDAVIAAAQARWGNAWTNIAELLPGRASGAVKNRWNSTIRRNNRRNTPDAFGRATGDSVARALQEARRGMEIIDRDGSLHAPARINAAARREHGASAAARREITSLCHEMTEAVDLLVSPQLARQEIRALCRSMTEEVDARAAAARLASAPSPIARKAGERWGAEEETELRALVEEHRSKSSVDWNWLNIAQGLGTGRSAAAVESHWRVMRDRDAKRQRAESESDTEPPQKHRLLGADFDYHVGGLGWCRGRVAKVARGGLLEVHYKDLPHNAGRPQAAPRHLAAREVDAAMSNSKPRGASYYVAPQRTFTTGRRGSPGPKLEKPEIYKCGGCDRAFATLSGRSNHHRYCEAGRAFAAAEAAARALAASDDDASPRAVSAKRFPCPAGCDRFFTHAPAAVQHGKTCAAKQKAARERAFAHEASPPARREHGASAAARRELTSLCHEMTEAVDLLVSPQFARQEIRALCRSMTEEVEHLVESPAESAPVPSARRPRTSVACGRCAQCLAEDCGECVYCLDKVKRGGAGRLRQRCLARRCTASLSSDARPPPPPTEEVDTALAQSARGRGRRARSAPLKMRDAADETAIEAATTRCYPAGWTSQSPQLRREARSEQAQSVSALAPSVARGSRSRPKGTGARFVAPPSPRAPEPAKRQRVYAPPPVDASPAVTLNGRGEPRWARGNHAQDANDATVRGIVIDLNCGNKDVATTTGTVVSIHQLTPTTLTDEEVASCVIPASQKDHVQARIDGKIRVDVVGRTFQNRFTAADGTERRQLVVTATHVRCALCPDARTWSTANGFTSELSRSLATHCGVYAGGRAHRERLAAATGLAAEFAVAPTEAGALSPPSSSWTPAAGDWRVVGAQVANADEPSVRGVIVRYRGPAFCEVRTTKDIVVNFKKSHLTQTSLTDEEAASCSRALSSTEYLQARVDGAICVRYAGREFNNCYTSADGTERRQFEVTATGDVRCAVCCGDAPFKSSSQTPWKTLAHDLKAHAGQALSQIKNAQTQTHLKSLFASAGVPMPEESFFAPAPVGAPQRVGTQSLRESSGESPKRQRSDAAPPPDESSDDEEAADALSPAAESADDEEAAVGRRVWALFEPDVWWGGTVVSISGVEDERACSIIFDDGVSQMFYERDVWSSPLAGGKVGAREPNAAARAAIQKALSTKATTPRLKPRKRPKRGSYAESSVPAPAPAPRRVTPVAPSGNCPICYDRLTADATVFECSHAMCASCSDSYAKSEVERSMSRRSGVSVACPLCRAPSKVVLPEEMHTSLPL